MRLFDYLFYRVYSFYKKKRDGDPEWSGAIVLTVAMGLTMLTINALVSLITGSSLIFTKVVLLLIFFLLLILFWSRYRKSEFVRELEDNYKQESIKSKKVNGWIIIFYLILVLLIPISIGYMRHNLGMDI